MASYRCLQPTIPLTRAAVDAIARYEKKGADDAL